MELLRQSTNWKAKEYLAMGQLGNLECKLGVRDHEIISSTPSGAKLEFREKIEMLGGSWRHSFRPPSLHSKFPSCPMARYSLAFEFVL